MEFGKITPSALAGIAFSLPPEPAKNKSVLIKGKINSNSEVFIGCARWSNKNWQGSFYPTAIKEKEYLSYYSKLFNCVELNATYYTLLSQKQIQSWREQVETTFRFCPKFPQIITHTKRLRNCTKEVDAFLQSVTTFENNLGPLFLMPHPQMGIQELPLIEQFIKQLPHDVDVFLELRHPDWFIDGLNERLYDFVVKYNIGLVITDAAGRRDCVHMNLSKEETFVRFVGNNLHPTDYTRTLEWAQRIALWKKEGLQKLYFFIHQHDELNAPQLATYFIQQLNSAASLHISIPKTMIHQQTLFD